MAGDRVGYSGWPPDWVCLTVPLVLHNAWCMLAIGSQEAHLPFDRFCFSSCWVTCHSPRQHIAGGRAGVDTDHLSMRQVVLGYNVTSSRVLNPDLTEKRYWKQKRHWSKGLPSLIVHLKCVSSAIGSDGCPAWGFVYFWALTCSKYHMSWMSSSLFLWLSSITNLSLQLMMLINQVFILRVWNCEQYTLVHFIDLCCHLIFPVNSWDLNLVALHPLHCWADNHLNLLAFNMCRLLVYLINQGCWCVWSTGPSIQ